LAASAGPNTDQSAISSVLQTIPTKITAQLVPMEGGPYKQEVVISVSDLIVPKQIDLEAPSNA
jgi:pantothenate kinase